MAPAEMKALKSEKRKLQQQVSALPFLPPRG
jgi:hypothetical protein